MSRLTIVQSVHACLHCTRNIIHTDTIWNDSSSAGIVFVIMNSRIVSNGEVQPNLQLGNFFPATFVYISISHFDMNDEVL
jgi:hypothetical protein